jgi:hypothetical protein
MLISFEVDGSANCGRTYPTSETGRNRQVRLPMSSNLPIPKIKRGIRLESGRIRLWIMKPSRTSNA